MALPPARTEISDTYPNPSNAVARVGFGKFFDYATGLLGATGNAAEARAALGVKAAGTYAGYLGLSSNTTLTLADIGKYIVFGSNGLTATLPLGSSVPVGAVFHFGPGARFTIARSGADTIAGPPGSGQTSVTMGGACEVVWRGDMWQVGAGGDPVSLTGTGYVRLPSGLIVQWSSTTQATNSSGGGGIAWPITFPNAVLWASVANGDNSALWAGSIIASQLTVANVGFQTTVVSGVVRANLFGIGY